VLLTGNDENPDDVMSDHGRDTTFMTSSRSAPTRLKDGKFNRRSSLPHRSIKRRIHSGGKNLPRIINLPSCSQCTVKSA